MGNEKIETVCFCEDSESPDWLKVWEHEEVWPEPPCCDICGVPVVLIP